LSLTQPKRADVAPPASTRGANGDPMLGRTVDGRFTILAHLGAGSMGTVYRARQNAMRRDVALKILRADRALDEQAKNRFLREARANSSLSSRHTVAVFDFGQSASGELFLAMELLEGESVGQRIHHLGRIPAEQALETCRQALLSLGEAHAKGIIHRDLKPDNLFYAKVLGGRPNEEMLKVLDFGVAKIMGDVGEPMNAVETQAGTVFGTPRYMSPEQAQGKPLDGRSDLYALGVILYEMIAGRPPFTDEEAIVVMARHIKAAPPTFVTVAPDLRVPPEVEALVMRLLAKDANARPATADALFGEIAKLMDGGKSVARGVRLAVSTAPPFRRPEPAHSLGPTAASRSLETLELVGGTSRAAPWTALAIVALALSGAAAFGARELLESQRASDATQPAIGATRPGTSVAVDSPGALPTLTDMNPNVAAWTPDHVVAASHVPPLHDDKSGSLGGTAAADAGSFPLRPEAEVFAPPPPL
jgi:tRNA A-37 threonylcarbamoyl transferase component Bud32